MFEVLLGSRAERRPIAGRGIVAAALHGVVLAFAVRATTAPPPPPPPPKVDTTVFVLPARASVPVAAVTAAGPAISAPTVDLPPVPLAVPSGIPPVTLGPVLDPELLRRSVPGGPAVSSATPGRDPSGTWLEAEVDQPAVPVRQPSPRYPPILREAGVEGRVVLEFIIDTTGRIEPGSLAVVERTAPGFDAAALESLTHSLFTPARVKGQAVRQRARQAISFRLRTP